MFNSLLSLFQGAAASLGLPLAIFGMALAFIPAACGSAYGVSKTGQTMSGIVSEKPEVYSKLQIIQLLPATQGLYGFLIAILAGVQMNIFGTIPTMTLEQGLSFVVAALPIAIVGPISAVYQANSACSAMVMVGKAPEMSGKGILMVAAVELYAIFGLLVSFLLVMFGISL
ncbi:MAG: V-type ATP synthase subunit K [Clostridia bacterium]|nr:V-type ATP synthase subunit K [Clostridia bacterium]